MRCSRSRPSRAGARRKRTAEERCGALECGRHRAFTAGAMLKGAALCLRVRVVIVFTVHVYPSAAPPAFLAAPLPPPT
eukprot:3304374-Prymnesium_polylepis.1